MDVLALQAGVILGLTSVFGKLIPKKFHDKVLPLAALVIGVGAVYGTEGMEAMTVALAFKGIVLGGTITGLYATAKDMKKTPNTVASI